MQNSLFQANSILLISCFQNLSLAENLSPVSNSDVWFEQKDLFQVNKSGEPFAKLGSERLLTKTERFS